MRQVIICRCHRGPAGALRRDAPLKAERAGELAAERFRSQAGDPGAGGIEPLAERFGACAAGRPPPRCLPASRRALTMALRTTGTTTVTRNARPAQLGPVPGPAAPGADRRWPARSRRSERTSLASRSEPEHDICGRYSGYSEDITVDNVSSPGPEPAAITAKTARMGLEITADQRAVIKSSSHHRQSWLQPSRHAARPVYLCSAALGATARFCRDEGRPDHDRSSGSSATWRIRSTGL